MNDIDILWMIALVNYDCRSLIALHATVRHVECDHRVKMYGSRCWRTVGEHEGPA